MDRALLDTDILSEIAKGKDAKVAARAAAYHAAFGRFTFSVFSVLEVVKGYHRVRRPDRIARFLANIGGEEVLTLGVPAAELAGRIFADLELIGRPIRPHRPDDCRGRHRTRADARDRKHRPLPARAKGRLSADARRLAGVS